MIWKPIVEENEKLKSKLSEIATVLFHSSNSKENISLMGGKTGEAIFFYYYSTFTNEQKYANHGFKLLTEVFETINKGYSNHTFAAGLAGIGWTIEHLVQQGFLDAETTDLLNDLDEYLFNCMMSDIKKGDYDYIHGAIGIGLYFSNRSNKKKAKEYLKQFIDELEKLGEEDTNGAIKWESIIDKEKNTKGYNISLSHGMSSIIVFLSKLYENKISEQKTFKLLNGAVNYLLQQQLDSTEFTSSFPNLAKESMQALNSRLAWCYGDLGIGMALWQASQSTKNKSWEKLSLEVLLKSTLRTDPKECLVVDAGLCHGTAGIAHIYNRMYFNTMIKEFKEASEYWLTITLKLATHPDGYAGYKVRYIKKYGGWIDSKALLEGVTGIGLSLISNLSDIEAKWDECLLLS